MALMPHGNNVSLSRCCVSLLLVLRLAVGALGGAHVLAAQTLPRMNTLHHQSWSTEDGLPQDSVHWIFQDKSGFIWVATEGGLVRFDGVAFRVFRRETDPAFRSDDVCCIAEDHGGDLWVGTSDGLMRRHDQMFTRLTERDGLPSPAIQALLRDADGSLLVVTGAGLVRWRMGRIEPVPHAPPDVENMAPAGNGGVWLLGKGQVRLLKDGSLTTPSLGLPPTSVPLQMTEDQARSNLWITTATTVQRSRAGQRRRWQVGRDIGGRRIESLFVDRAGTAWVGTNDGVAVIASDGAEPVEIPSLRGNSVLHSFEDREGNDWIGTEASGLHVLRSLPFSVLAASANKPLPAIVQSATGAVWFGTRRDGLLRLDKDRLDAPVHPEDLTSSLILALTPGLDGSIWAGTPDGLNHVSADGRVQRVTSANGMPDDYIQALASEGNGCVWAGTRQGLAHVCASQVDILTHADGLDGDVVGALLAASNGDLWIGTSAGLSRRMPDGRLTHYTTGFPLTPGIVSAMAEDAAGRLWVATRHAGLSRIAAGRVSPVPSRVFDANVLDMIVDKRGSLWLRRERGLDQVDVADLDRCVEAGPACSLRVRHYGTADGLPSEEMTPLGTPGMTLMANGELWVATRGGVGMVNPPGIEHNQVRPGLAIEDILLDGVPLPIEGEALTVPYGARRITIGYAGLSFVVPSKVRYRFKLEGFDKQWTEAGARRSATYTNLPPRHYIFRVQAMNNDGVWNETGATLPFRVLPPFYRRLWFLLLIALALVTILSTLYRLRLRRMRKQFEAVLGERNRMAREIHDTLAQDFVGVTLQLDIISQLLGTKRIEAASQQVQVARKLVTEGLAEARQSIWELRANSAADSLPTRLGRVVERYSGSKTVLRTRIGGAFRPLDPRIETAVLRVAQEALSNIQRHADAENASLTLHYGPGELVLTVEDDGRGFNVEEALQRRERYGLGGLGERAVLLGGKLEIVSEPGKGTKLTLTTEGVPRKETAR